MTTSLVVGDLVARTQLVCKRGQETRTDEWCSLAMQIAKRIVPTTGLHIRSCVERYEQVCREIDDVKIRAIGQHGSTDMSNKLMQLVGCAVVRIATWDKTDIEWLYARMAESERMSSRIWLMPKLYHLIVPMSGVQAIREYGRQHHLDGMLQLGSHVLANNVDMTQRSANTLFDGIRELRRWGIKPALFQSSLSRIVANVTGKQQPGWVYHDAMEYRAHSSIVAAETLATATIVANSSLELERAAHGNDQSVRWTTVGINGALLTMFVTRDGTLDVSYGYCILPVQEILTQCDVAERYEYLRLSTAWRLFDLTVAVIAVQRTSSQEHGILRRILGRVVGNAQIDFVLPRIQLLDNPAERQREIEQELEEDRAEGQGRRNHRVEAHPRRLPPGAQASASALALAREHGIVLKPNETYVRMHRRGNGEPMPTVRIARTRTRTHHRPSQKRR